MMFVLIFFFFFFFFGFLFLLKQVIFVMSFEDAIAGGLLQVGLLIRRGILIYLFGEEDSQDDLVYRAVSSVLMLGVMIVVGIRNKYCGNPIIQLYYCLSDDVKKNLLNLIPAVLGQAAAGSLVLRAADYAIPAWNNRSMMECVPTNHSDGALLIREILSTASLVIIIGMSRRKGISGWMPVPFSYFLITLFWTDPCMNPASAISHAPYFSRGSALQPLSMGSTTGAALAIYILSGTTPKATVIDHEKQPEKPTRQPQQRVGRKNRKR